MSALSLAADARLAAVSRFGTARTATVSKTELLFLLGVGAGTAVLRTVLDLRLQVPGHSILLVVLPIVMGRAATPRRGAGTVIGAGAAGTAALLWLAPVGARFGLGAFTSLVLTGPLLDLFLRLLPRGPGVYLACVTAGTVSNMLAFAVKAVLKLAGMNTGLHPGAIYEIWITRAALTYPACGVIAGLLSAWICFRFRRAADPDSG